MKRILSGDGEYLIVSQIMKKLKNVMPDFPVFVKLNGQERGGLRITDAAEYAILCEKTGVDAIEVSCALNDDFFMTDTEI